MQKPDLQGYSSKRPLPKPIIAIILRLFFRLLYHQFAWAYDGVAWVVSIGSWQKWVNSVVPFVRGPKILEIGFGPGHLLATLSGKGLITFGLDESQQMIQLASKRLKNLALRRDLLRGEAQSLPLANESLHQVVMTFPAEYILNPATLVEIHRVLMKGGVAHILPFAWITGRAPWHRLAAWVNHVTGEAPAWDERMLEPLENSGFKTNWEMQNFDNSKAVLIHLTKI
jgi:ubiquinone/menaquinone biosynthesis C-methylase UbiE